ncbi:serine hydrolase domain-containing protein [Zhongshania aquimaris]|uniref:Beta-lactamase family protein n=1 Tax=Zhongshania aquimaris TaxID=2857107 RepID=A0ABS6VW34_9GAMM|nr:serine hydrolase domain-containing protein [Zhongshania aquimaris]MBW2942544.1 beta-lactamase family protein [Zhongshania aquimaris]
MLSAFTKFTHAPSRLALGICISLLAGQLFAGAIAVESPEKVGVSSDRLSRISRYMDKALASGDMVGGLGLIARDGKVIYLQGYGDADKQPQRKMDQDTLFRIYSMSKPITSVAVLMLYEEGHFALNDPIARYLPELANLQLALSTADSKDQLMLSDGTSSKHLGSGDLSKVGQTRAPRRQPTIRDLLTHTAGFSYGLFGNTEVDKLYREAGLSMGNLRLKEFVEKLGSLPLQYEPGTRWHYSIATDVLGRLVEVISGMPFDEFLQQRIFNPLDMSNTGFTVSDEDWPRLAQLYSPRGTSEEIREAFLNIANPRNLVEAPASFDINFKPGAVFKSGGGGLVSSIGDYFRFSQMLLNGGELEGRRLLSPKTIQLMSSNHLTSIGEVFGRAGTGFGLGVAVSTDQAAFGELGTEGEYNWGGAAGTKFWIDPKEKMIGIFMTQSIPHLSRVGVEFKYLSYQAIIDSYLDDIEEGSKAGFWNNVFK